MMALCVEKGASAPHLFKPHYIRDKIKCSVKTTKGNSGLTTGKSTAITRRFNSIYSIQLLSTNLPHGLEREVRNRGYTPISMAFLGVKLLPIEAIMTKPIADHCNKVSCSLKITRP
ncbi:MAG: hypothetical protein ACI808_003012, partial [Paraglaciecola sp.]